MTHQHLHHAHKPREPSSQVFGDYIERDPRFARAIAEHSEPLLPRDPQSGDNYGVAPAGSGSNPSGSNYGSGTSSGSSASSSPSSCNPAFDSTCQTNGTSTNTIPIVLGVVIPVSFFVIAMLVIWRIKKKRSRMEEAEDKHASLDFGLGEVSRKDRRNPRKKGRKGQPQMMDLNAEKQFRKDRGLSLDDVGSPYVLPGELNDSRPSFHSLSRSAHDQEDPYRPVALLKSDSLNSRPGSPQDNHSIWTQSSHRTAQGGMRSALVDNAQPPSSAHPAYHATGETPLLGATSPLISPSLPIEPSPLGPAVPRKPVAQPTGTSNVLSPLDPRNPPQTVLKPNDELFTSDHADASDPQWDQPALTLPPASSNNLPTFRFTEEPPDNDYNTIPPPPPKRSSLRQPSPEQPRHESLPEFDDYTTYADVLGIVQKESVYPEEDQGLGVYGVDSGNHRLSASIRPLPPDDPFDNPEDRANRIRSFYKEYFDEKRGTMADPAGHVDYYEDYNQEYLDGATVWDPQSGQFVVDGYSHPYAEPITRRAMTPPPRAPPRFRNGSAGGRMYGSGQYGPGRQRGYSSASAAVHGRRAKKPLPPPKPLNNLPTPHLLRDDSAIFNAADFAPPTSWEDRVAGRPESPAMEKRPYSPHVKAFTPLKSSFNELRAMPSPFALRKSGTFTGLDFAPPPRINHDSMSDAGSVRSGRSTTSHRQVANIRAGAYRVSRLPGEFVGTKDDFATALKPRWDQRGPATGI